MAKFTVCYRMVCNGTVTVEAETELEAAVKAENLAASDLGREAEDVETEIVSVDGKDVEELGGDDDEQG